jgi:hypothetical protein
VQVAANSSNPDARVTFTYDLSTAPLKRDRETQQKWLTGEAPVFDYPSPTKTTSTDALAQAREYELTSATDNDKRVHVKTLTEKDVPILTLPDPLPAAAAVNMTATPQPLVTTYGYNEHGQIASLTAPDGRLDQPSYDNAKGGAAGHDRLEDHHHRRCFLRPHRNSDPLRPHLFERREQRHRDRPQGFSHAHHHR